MKKSIEKYRLNFEEIEMNYFSEKESSALKSKKIETLNIEREALKSEIARFLKNSECSDTIRNSLQSRLDDMHILNDSLHIENSNRLSELTFFKVTD